MTLAEMGFKSLDTQEGWGRWSRRSARQGSGKRNLASMTAFNPGGTLARAGPYRLPAGRASGGVPREIRPAPPPDGARPPTAKSSPPTYLGDIIRANFHSAPRRRDFFGNPQPGVSNWIFPIANKAPSGSSNSRAGWTPSRRPSSIRPSPRPPPPEASDFVIQLNGLEYISSAGLRSILMVAKQVKARSGRLILTGLTDEVREVFHLSGFHTILRICDTKEAALAELA
jgi:hypothetical protein